MTLIEALKSGRRIRNCDVGKCVWFEPDKNTYWRSDYVLSETWEVEPEPKKKETRWLWAAQEGTITLCLFPETDPIVNKYPIKLEWSATEFEVD